MKKDWEAKQYLNPEIAEEHNENVSSYFYFNIILIFIKLKMKNFY